MPTEQTEKKIGRNLNVNIFYYDDKAHPAASDCERYDETGTREAEPKGGFSTGDPDARDKPRCSVDSNSDLKERQ